MVIQQKPGFWARLKNNLFNWLGLTSATTIKVYHGYGHTDHMVINGHVFKLSPLSRSKYKKSVVKNALALLRLFMVKPYPHVQLQMQWQNQILNTTADEKGFFKFEWKDEPPLEVGWHEVTVHMLVNGNRNGIEGKGYLYIPHTTQYGFISDIDDTFLISHSANLRKRLFVLFTQNARTREPFEGSVRHYELLTSGNTTPDAPNPFFFVSSSEWNLYDYLLEFTTVNGLPRGVFLLNVLKQFNELLKTGQNNHQTKFTRIVRIIEGFPHQKFVLLGDSSQHDPYIYESIVRHFPDRIHAVYIRDVHKPHYENVKEVLQKIAASGVHSCFFQHSEEAISHSRQIGLINEEDIVAYEPATAH